MRRILISLSTLSTVAVAYVMTAPGAFAMRVHPISGGSTSFTASPVTHSSGLEIWQLALIVTASALVVATVAAFAVTRASRRRYARPAVG
jgi:hypothetical protein